MIRGKLTLTEKHKKKLIEAINDKLEELENSLIIFKEKEMDKSERLCKDNIKIFRDIKQYFNGGIRDSLS